MTELGIFKQKVEQLIQDCHSYLGNEELKKGKLVKTAYKTNLWRQPILTNQRILFLKDDEVDYEISMEDILKAETKRAMRTDDPYLKLNLKNGKPIHMVFESIRERER